MLVIVLALALVAAVVWPRVGLADGAGPATGAAVGTGPGQRGTGGGAGTLWTGRVGPAPVLLGECSALPCLLEMEINGEPGYLIVDYPNPRG